MNINYFLVEANRFKLINYKKIPLDYILDLISFVYDGNSLVNLTKKFTKGSVIEGDGKKYFYFNLDMKTGDSDSAPYSIINTQRYLATMSTNTIVKQIYLMSFTNPAYRELAFVMFLLGVVNTEDYLAVCRDVTSVTSRFNIKYKRSGYASNGILITCQDYIGLLGLFYKNAMKGVRYGVNPLDFIWNACEVAKKFVSEFPITGVVSALRSTVGVLDTLPEVDEKTFIKYADEIAVVAGFTKLSERDKVKLIDYFAHRNTGYSGFGILFDIFSTSEYIKLNDAVAVRGELIC